MENHVCEDVSNVATFGAVDYSLFVSMLLFSTFIGVFYSFVKRTDNTSTEFFLAGRSMSYFPTAMSLMASALSAVVLLGNPAEIYVYGSQIALAGVAYALTTPFIIYFFMPVYRKLHLTSTYEYCTLRFNIYVRILASGVFMLQSILYMATSLYGPALALNQVTGWNHYFVAGIFCIVCVFYTALGGLRAVIWADLLQGFIMFAAEIAIIIKGSIEVGSPSEVWEINDRSGRIEFFNMNPDPTIRHTFWSVVVGSLIKEMAKLATNQQYVQRFMAASSLNQARKSLWANMIGVCAMLSMTYYTGILTYAKYKDCDPLTTKRIIKSDQLLPLFILDTMGDVPGFSGLFVAGVFSASLSTVSTGLNSLATVMVKDFVGLKWKLSDAQTVNIAKWFSAVFGLIAFGLIFVVENLGALVQISGTIVGSTIGTTFGIFTLGMFYPWCNSTGAISGSIVSLACLIWINIEAYIARSEGLIVYPTRPTSVEGCVCNISSIIHNGSAPAERSVFPLYEVSYQYNAVIGLVLTVVIGLLVSFLTTPQDPAKVDKNLLSPVALWIFNALPNCLRIKLRLPDWKEEEKNLDTPLEEPVKELRMDNQLAEKFTFNIIDS